MIDLVEEITSERIRRGLSRKRLQTLSGVPLHRQRKMENEGTYKQLELDAIFKALGIKLVLIKA